MEIYGDESDIRKLQQTIFSPSKQIRMAGQVPSDASGGFSGPLIQAVSRHSDHKASY